MVEIKWDIRRQGRAWSDDETLQRLDLIPARIEIGEGKMFMAQKERLTMLALLLENVGIDEAIKLGNPEIWREAIANYQD